MAGRPRNKTSIVAANEVMTAQAIRMELWHLATLSPELDNTESALQWCARRRLLHNTKFCQFCNQLYTLRRYTHGIDGRRWSCGTRKSVRDGSFFKESSNNSANCVDGILLVA